MIDDPFALLAYGILLLAGGMYPIGFLFGACSACCDEAEEGCDRCTRVYEFCNAYESISLTFDRGDTFVLTGINDNTYSSNCIQPQFFLLDQGFDGCGNLYDVYARVEFVAALGTNDPSGCYKPIFSPSVILEFRGRGFTLFCGGTSVHELPSCDSASASFVRGAPTGCFDGNLCQVPLTNYVNALGKITYHLTLKQCECGACCEVFSSLLPGGSNEVLCSENVAENGCGFSPGFDEQNKYTFRLLSSEWQGVGVECNPNPCEE